MTTYISSTTFMYEAVFAGLILALIAGQASIRIARRMGLIDLPGVAVYKNHKVPMPLAGGIALGLALPLLVLIFGLWDNSEMRYMLVAGLMILVVGLWDDARRLPPVIKFAGQILAAVLLNASGIYIQIFETQSFFVGGSELIYELLDRGLTIFWVIGVTNAFNLVDSMDGLSVGLGAWAFGFFMLATFDSQQLGLSLFSAIMLGQCLGLLFHNISPARPFMGDAGAQLLGFLFAVIAILYTPPAAEQNSSWFVPILLVSVPIFDTSLVVISRLRRHLPFYRGGRDHTYHRLVDFGMAPGRAVLVMHLAAVLLQCVAFMAFSMEPLIANGIFLACVILGAVGIIVLDHRKIWA